MTLAAARSVARVARGRGRRSLLLAVAPRTAALEAVLRLGRALARRAFDPRRAPEGALVVGSLVAALLDLRRARRARLHDALVPC